MSYQLHRGDALTVMRTLADGSVSAVIANPPSNASGSADPVHTGCDACAKSVTSGSAHDYAQIAEQRPGAELTQDDFVLAGPEA